MPTFLVERYLDGWSAERLDALVDLIVQLSPSFATAGVAHVGSVAIPADECCLSIFEGDDGAGVRLVNERAGLPVHRVVEAHLHGLRPHGEQ